MLTSRLTVEVWWCSNANQAGTLLPVCLSTLPTAVEANEAHGQSFSDFYGEFSFRLRHSFASAKFKKKERKKERKTSSIPTSCSPLRGHRFLGPTHETIAQQFCKKSYLNLACVAEGGVVYHQKKGGRKRAVSPQCEVRLKMATADFAIMRLTAQPHWKICIFFQTWRQKF